MFALPPLLWSFVEQWLQKLMTQLCREAEIRKKIDLSAASKRTEAILSSLLIKVSTEDVFCAYPAHCSSGDRSPTPWDAEVSPQVLLHKRPPLPTRVSVAVGAECLSSMPAVVQGSSAQVEDLACGN